MNAEPERAYYANGEPVPRWGTEGDREPLPNHDAGAWTGGYGPADRDAGNVPTRVMHCDDPETYARGYNEGYADSAMHHFVRDDEIEDAVERGRCTRPPEGWWCSLPEGHSGPCPAREEPITARLVQPLPDRDADDVPTFDDVLPLIPKSTRRGRIVWEDADNVPSDRARDYAEAIHFSLCGGGGCEVDADDRLAARAVMAVADREQATLLAEIAGLRAMAERRAALQAADDERVDRLYDQIRDRAEKAEAEIERLRASLATMDHFADVAETCERKANEAHAARQKAEATIARVEALADEWDGQSDGERELADRYAGYHAGARSARLKAADDLRAALRGPEPAENNPEHDPGTRPTHPLGSFLDKRDQRPKPGQA